MNPLLYVKYGATALVLAVISYYVWDYHATKRHNIELSQTIKATRAVLSTANEETEVANQNVELLGAEYGKLQNETEAWRKRQHDTQRAQQKAEQELRAITANLAAPYASTKLNKLLCQSFASASGESWDCDHQQAVQPASASSLANGSWFIFDQENTNALISNIRKMSNYIANIETANQR